jgi:endo-1,4-beta-xylanase
MRMNRRTFVTTAATAVAIGSLELAGPNKSWAIGAAPADQTTIGAAGASRGILAGAGIDVHHLRDDPKYTALVKQQCGILVEINKFKFDATQPTPTQYNFTDTDYVMNFAQTNHIPMRAHNLVWHNALPKWFSSYVTPQNAEQVLVGHIETLMGRYAGKVQSWDVVNEALQPKDGLPGGLRNTPWYKMLGPGYIDLAFRSARRADPSAMLCYNDFGIEDNYAGANAKRAALMDMVRGMQKRGVPIDAIGIQSHIIAKPNQKFNQDFGTGIMSMISELSSMGLKVLITEFDVADRFTDTSTQARDEAVANLYSEYMTMVLSDKAVCAFLTWGLVDTYSVSMDKEQPRADNTPNRPWPFDSNYQPKPAFFAEVKALGSAPMRPPVPPR